jgi:pimeloyl-ACP methyl ester carboxylesterase
MGSPLRLLALAALGSAAACRPAPSARPERAETGPAPSASAPPAPVVSARPEPVRVEPLDPSERPPTFVLLGARGSRDIVFLHGLCGHAQGYVQSFQFAAARHGLVVAPQGDVLCGSGPWSSWSGDVTKVDRRIVRAFAALGTPEPQEVAVIGYSLGATLALGLARRFPDRYTRLVLIAAPDAPSAQGLPKVRSTVMLAGSRDRKDLMRRGVAAMRGARIPSTFLELPGASHGEMGNDPERVMGEALSWLFEHDRESP